MKVLDASVVLKWYLQEEDSELALGFRQKFISGSFNLAFPDLIIYELPNALRYEKSFSLNATYEAVGALIDLGVDIIVPTRSLVRNALELSFERNITFYDASYIALALELGYDFVTADVKLFKKIKSLKLAKLLSESIP